MSFLFDIFRVFICSSGTFAGVVCTKIGGWGWGGGGAVSRFIFRKSLRLGKGLSQTKKGLNNAKKNKPDDFTDGEIYFYNISEGTAFTSFG